MQIMTAKLISIGCMVLTVLAVSACSQQQVYESFTSAQRIECQKEPPSQYEECLQQTQDSYDKYKREREEIINEEEKEAL